MTPTRVSPRGSGKISTSHATSDKESNFQFITQQPTPVGPSPHPFIYQKEAKIKYHTQQPITETAPREPEPVQIKAPQPNIPKQALSKNPNVVVTPVLDDYELYDPRGDGSG